MVDCSHHSRRGEHWICFVEIQQTDVDLILMIHETLFVRHQQAVVQLKVSFQSHIHPFLISPLSKTTMKVVECCRLVSQCPNESKMELCQSYSIETCYHSDPDVPIRTAI